MRSVFVGVAAAAGAAAFSIPAEAADVTPRPPILAPARIVVVPAAPLISGYLEGFGGASWYRFSEYDPGGALVATERSRSTAFGGALRLAATLAPQWRVQGDAWSERDNYRGQFCAPPGACSDDPHFQHVWGLGGHLTYVPFGGPQFGVLASFGGNNNTIDGATRFANLGGEVLARHGVITLYGQAGFVRSLSGVLAPENAGAWYLHGEARVFLTPNLMLAGNLGFARYGLDDITPAPGVLITGRHADIWRWGARAEFKFANAPLSLFASYQGGRVAAPYAYNGAPYNDRITDTTVLGGLRLWLHQDTLEGNDRTGANLADWNPVFGTGVVVY